MADADTLIEYPSRFPIKVLGHNVPGFEQAMVDIALRFDPQYDRNTLEQRPSSGGKYLGLTQTLLAAA
jgi:uncharacterized protein